MPRLRTRDDKVLLQCMPWTTTTTLSDSTLSIERLGLYLEQLSSLHGAIWISCFSSIYPSLFQSSYKKVSPLWYTEVELLDMLVALVRIQNNLSFLAVLNSGLDVQVTRRLLAVIRLLFVVLRNLYFTTTV